MSGVIRRVARPVLGATLFCSLLSAGCAAHRRYYDPYYRDYHPRGGEVVYYEQWERETHRPHLDFERRSEEDRRAYWDWRHHHEVH